MIDSETNEKTSNFLYQRLLAKFTKQPASSKKAGAAANDDVQSNKSAQ